MTGQQGDAIADPIAFGGHPPQPAADGGTRFVAMPGDGAPLLGTESPSWWSRLFVGAVVGRAGSSVPFAGRGQTIAAAMLTTSESGVPSRYSMPCEGPLRLVA